MHLFLGENILRVIWWWFLSTVFPVWDDDSFELRHPCRIDSRGGVFKMAALPYKPLILLGYCKAAVLMRWYARFARFARYLLLKIFSGRGF